VSVKPNIPTKTVILAGGGSGGHISPGLAIAERIAELDRHAASIFICSQREIDRSMLSDAGAEFFPVPATPPSKNPIAACRFLVNFQASKSIIKRLIRERRVSQVITLGGFVAAPAVIAAGPAACR
jgi:UDP-N-acetylglucosamine--N-acetylmuramyl-(pentapeptide) pyrophosphoryl-undecaprenol N-acetylglucosamine transferase